MIITVDAQNASFFSPTRGFAKNTLRQHQDRNHKESRKAGKMQIDHSCVPAFLIRISVLPISPSLPRGFVANDGDLRRNLLKTWMLRRHDRLPRSKESASDAVLGSAGFWI